MKLLIDSCVAGAVARRPIADGHDVALALDQGADPGDRAILDRAAAEGRAIITIDADFGALVSRDNATRVGVLRLREQPSAAQAARTADLVAAHGAALEQGAFVTDDGASARVSHP